MSTHIAIEKAALAAVVESSLKALEAAHDTLTKFATEAGLVEAPKAKKKNKGGRPKGSKTKPATEAAAGAPGFGV